MGNVWRRCLMGQKNKNKTTSWLIAGLVIAIIALGAISFNLSGDGTDEVTGNVIKETIEASGNAEFCANNPALDAKVRILDTLASDKTYLSGTILIQNLDTGSIVEGTVTASGTAFTTISDAFDCNSEKGYMVYIKGGSTLNSGDAVEITPDMLAQDPVEFTMEASQYTPFKVKGYDNSEKEKMVDFAGTAGTDYVTTLTSSFNASTSSFSSSADENIDVTFTLQPNVTNKAKGTGLIIAINTEDESNLDDYDESLAQVFWNNVELEPATGLSENELRAVNSYELLYKIPETVGADEDGDKSPQASLRVVLTPEADASSKDFDPVIKLVALGDYESVDTDEVLEGVGFQDNSARTELYSAQTITIKVG